MFGAHKGRKTSPKHGFASARHQPKNADRAIKLWKIRLLNGFGHMRAFDCSGLIIYYLNREGTVLRYV